MVVQSGNQSKVLSTAQSELKLLETYRVELPTMTGPSSAAAKDTDMASLLILSKFHPIALDDVLPLSVIGDGNCLYRAVSLGCFGTQEYHEHLRLLTVLEMITNRTYYDCAHRKYIDLINDPRILPEPFSSLVYSACHLGSYQQMSHIYALSAAIKFPIKSYYPPTACNDFLTNTFSRTVFGRNVSQTMNTAAIVMWTMMSAPERAKDFHPNHFVLLNQNTETIDIAKSPFKIDLSREEIVSEDCEPVNSVHASGDSYTDNFSQPKGNSVSVSKDESYSDGDGDSVGDMNSNRDGDWNSDSDSSIEFIQPNRRSTPALSEESLLIDDSPVGSVSSPVSSNVSADSPGISPLSILRARNEKDAKGLLPDGKFLSIDTIIDVLCSRDNIISKVPCGPKENVYYLVDNTKNVERRKRNIKSEFLDDCGVYSKGASPSHYYYDENGKFVQLVMKNNLYCKSN